MQLTGKREGDQFSPGGSAVAAFQYSQPVNVTAHRGEMVFMQSISSARPASRPASARSKAQLFPSLVHGSPVFGAAGALLG